MAGYADRCIAALKTYLGLPADARWPDVLRASVVKPTGHRQPWPAPVQWGLDHAANGLGVSKPQAPGAWLRSMVLLPPDEARPWPRAVALASARLMRNWREAWQVPTGAGLLHWLRQAVFVSLPKPPPPGAQARWLRAVLLAPVVWLLEPVLRVLSWPARALSALLDRVDFEPITAAITDTAERTVHSSPLLRWLAVVLACALFVLAASAPLSTGDQALFLIVTVLMAMVVKRMPGDLPILLLIGLSLLASGRYVWWRLTETLALETPLDIFLGGGLLAAELYTWIVMILGYVQSAWPLRRKPARLPDDIDLWPTVDVFIPTYNEPLKIVRPTVLAAMNLNWPADKLNIYILDDGARDEFREFADMVGVGHLTREGSEHAKAGNLNTALKSTDGELVVIFDCDHLPVRSFLQVTVGTFLAEPKCAVLQTPHHFYSPDAFERNLHTEGRVPAEDKLFYGLLQDGNDLWNATFFCGSCAVIRRKPLLEVGGIAVETVTEDAHTALKMHRLGYTTAYLNVIQAAGLSTESLSGHVGQRIRWARGMAQIFRVDNPLFGKGLNLFQRLCYSNAMLHFFYGLPRLVFLTAPLAFLFFEAHVITAAASTLLAYVLPHLILATTANSRIQGQYRHSFWAEAYETVLAWYIVRPTTVALFAPQLGSFNVTAKGGLVEKSYFDWTISLPFLTIALLNMSGMAVGMLRLFVWPEPEVGTILVNLAWAFYNLIVLGTALLVCAEARQVRDQHRVAMHVPATVHLPDGQTIGTTTSDFSLSGLGLQLQGEAPVKAGDEVLICLQDDGPDRGFKATVMAVSPTRLGIQFRPMDHHQERHLILRTFGRADVWLSSVQKSGRDQPLESLSEVLRCGFSGYWQFLTFSLPAGLRALWQRRVSSRAAVA